MSALGNKDTTPRMGSGLENRRQVLVDELQIDELLDDLPYSKISQAAAAVCGTPMAFVSLMEDEWQCVIGQSGMRKVLDEMTEHNSVERDLSFCTYTISQGEILVVEDLQEDTRFSQHPFVTGDVGIRFYAGVPILIDDVPVGTLCALDTEPRVLPPRERGELFGLVHQLELSMEVRAECGPNSNESKVVDRLTDIMACSVFARYSASEDDKYRALTDIETKLGNVHRHLRRGTPGLAKLAGGMGGGGIETRKSLGEADTAVNRSDADS